MVKNLPANAGDAGSIPGTGRSPGGGSGNPLQYSCLKNPREALQATVPGGRKQLATTEHITVELVIKNLPAKAG